MIIVLNGPLGVGKSTLAESLTERLDRCVMLDGDHLVATNPPPVNEMEFLHSTIALLVEHGRQFGYQHFVIDHLWTTATALAELRNRLFAIDAEVDIRCFLLMLPLAENLRRIERRQHARAFDEHEYERRTVVEERRILFGTPDGELGEPFDVSASPERLVAELLLRLGINPPTSESKEV